MEVDAEALAARLGALPDEANDLVRLADGTRTAREVIEGSRHAAAEAAALLAGLRDAGVIRVVARAPARSPAGTPPPDGASWFGDPVEARRGKLSLGAVVAFPREETFREPLHPSKAPFGVVVGIVLLALAILIGPEWARRRTAPPQRESPAAPAPGAATPAPVAQPTEPPPALAITAPARSAISLPPSVPQPAEEAGRPVDEPSAPAAPPPVRGAPRPAAPRSARMGPGRVTRAAGYEEAFSDGAARHRSGDYEGAAAAYRRALGIEETSEAHAGLGLALSDARHPDEALAALRRAIALDAANGAAWLALGEVYLDRGDAAQARVAYQRYLAVDPAGRQAAEVRAVLQRLRP